MKEKPLSRVLTAMEKETLQKRKKLLDDAKAFAKQKKKEMTEKAEKDNEVLFHIEKKNITREMRRAEENIREEYLLGIVKAREAFTDKIWNSAKKRFISMPKRKTEYKKFMKRILSRVEDHESYVVYIRKEDSIFYKNARPAKISGGIIFRTKDGKIEIDYSLDGIVQRNEAAAKATINEVLFT